MQGFGIDDVAVAVARLDCKYSRLGSFFISYGLGGTKEKCWFYSPGACAGCHTSIHISDTLALKRAAI